MKAYFITEKEYKPFVEKHKDHILRVVNFTHSLDNSGPFLGKASIDPLTEKNYEIWVSSDKVTTFEKDGMLFYSTGDLIFARFESQEDKDLEAEAYNLYSKIFEVTKSQNLHLVRIWNYVPRILDEGGELERYRKFNLGRRRAWEEFGPKDDDGRFITPAASGIGALGGNLKTGVLFSKNKPVHIQNPRQINSFDYSEKYGPKPPLFSRATYLPNVGLFISGTASITKEDSVHIDDPIKQTTETMKNIEVLISDENLKKYGVKEGFVLADITDWRIYIKKIYQKDDIETEFLKHDLGDDLEYILLHDDICRKDLLVEIEGVKFL